MNSLHGSKEIDNEFLDFMLEKYEEKHKNGDDQQLVIAAPLPKIGTKDKIYTLPELIKEMKIRDEPYFKTMYGWFYDNFGAEFEAYRKYK